MTNLTERLNALGIARTHPRVTDDPWGLGHLKHYAVTLPHSKREIVIVEEENLKTSFERVMDIVKVVGYLILTLGFALLFDFSKIEKLCMSKSIKVIQVDLLSAVEKIHPKNIQK